MRGTLFHLLRNAKWKRRCSVSLLFLSILLTLTACQLESGGPNFSAYAERLQAPQSPALDLGGSLVVALTVGEDVYYDLRQVKPAADLQPLGMRDVANGYALQRDNQQTLWLCNFDEDERLAIVDYRNTSSTLDKEIVFNGRWLLWQEIGSYIPQTDGQSLRRCQLWLRDLSQPEAVDVVLDSGTTAPINGFFLPFDSLSLDNNSLVYRYSVFNNGTRETEVRLVDLVTQEIRTLATASEANNRVITRCSIGNQLVVWDLQIGYQVALSGLPPLNKARYNLFSYQLDSGKLTAREDPLTQLTMNRNYYAPLVYRDRIIAVEQQPATLGRYALGSSIVQITPLLNTVHRLIHNYDYPDKLVLYDSVRFSQRYDRGNQASRILYRYQPYIGKKLLTWGSNIAEHHIVVDLDSFRIVELPVYFSDAAEEVELVNTYFDRNDETWKIDVFSFQPNLENIRVTAIPGLDADYLYFEHIYNLDEPYILRVE